MQVHRTVLLRVPAGFTALGLNVRFYGMLIALGMLLAVLLAMRREKRFGLPRDTALDLALWGLPAAIIGARVYFVIFSWDYFAPEPIRALYIWEGGLAVYGGLLAGILTGLIYARRRRLSFPVLLDLAAPCFALGQAIGRWGNFFNQEAYGPAVSLPRLQHFPIAVYIEADGLWHLATFFYESACCALIAALLLTGERRGRFRKPGDEFLTYALLYGIERTLVEGLRTDSLYLGPVRISQALSLAVAVTAAILLAARRRSAPGKDPDHSYTEKR